MNPDLRAFGRDAKIYLKPTGLVDSPQYFEHQNRRLSNSLIWFSQIEYRIFEPGHPPIRGLLRVSEIDDFFELLPEPLDARAHRLFKNLTSERQPLTCGDRTIRFDQPHVMGILNMTPDSFSDGGQFAQAKDIDIGRAAEAGVVMASAGGSIIDVGGESTRPGADKVWEGDEIKRVVPVIERLAHVGAAISIDTRKAAVMRAAIDAGAHIINDISALLHEPKALEIAGVSGRPVVLMHAPSSGDDPHAGADYGDVVTDTFDWLEARIEAVVEAGLEREKIIADPGLGFGKAMADNMALINNIALFHALGVPLLIGASRKRMIGALANEAPVDKRLGGSVMLATRAIEQGAQIVRVHDVPETVQAVQVWRGLRDAGLTAPV